jgi:hypothetical protein
VEQQISLLLSSAHRTALGIIFMRERRQNAMMPPDERRSLHRITDTRRKAIIQDNRVSIQPDIW